MMAHTHSGAVSRTEQLGCPFLQVLADDRVNSYFQGTDMNKQRAHQVGMGQPKLVSASM